VFGETELIDKCKSGDEASQKLLYEHYYEIMFSICMRYTKKSEEARDLVHEGFYKIFNHLNNYSGKGSFEGWMKRIMVNAAIDHYKKKKKKKSLFSFIEDKGIESQLENLSTHYNEVSDNASQDINELNKEPLSLEMLHNANIMQADLLETLKQIPDKYSIVFNLFCIEELNHAEIAGKLNISEKTSRIRLMRARKYLQARLHELCIKKIGV
jgi:RNA polymerase sigma-70 factor (ECF subfamily)